MSCARLMRSISLPVGRSLRRGSRSLWVHGPRPGRPHRHPVRAHAARTLHGRARRRSMPATVTRRRLSGSAARSSPRRPRGWRRWARSRTRSTSRPGPMQEHKHDYLLWVGRITPDKGPHRAIAAARLAGVPLVLAGVIQPGQQAFFDREIAPHIDGDRVRFVGEVGGAEKRALFANARGAADADPLERAVRDGDGRGARVRDAGDRVPRGCRVRARRRRRDRLPRRMTSRRWRTRSAGCRRSPREIAGRGSPSTATSTSSPPHTRRPTGRSRIAPPSGRCRLSERTLSVLDGSTFVIGDRHGDVRAHEGREHGFFSEDTRFLSRWVLNCRRRTA